MIGASLYNFLTPSQLKGWIDRIAQAGRTFKYTGKGPAGLTGGKTIVVASARGGVYSTSDASNTMKHQESYLKTVFDFFGVTDVRVTRAEGLAMGGAAKVAALTAAQVEILAQTHSAANQSQAAFAAWNQPKDFLAMQKNPQLRVFSRVCHAMPQACFFTHVT